MEANGVGAETSKVKERYEYDEASGPEVTTDTVEMIKYFSFPMRCLLPNEWVPRLTMRYVRANPI